MSANSNKTNLNPKRRLRVYARIFLKGEVYIHNEEELYVAPLNNISAGGCFVDQFNKIPEGSQVKIIVKSDRLNSPIQAKGIIARVEKDRRKGSAIEFTSIGENSRDAIQTLVYENKVQDALKVI
jgi:c-di-GMP-binding flagellar brake protein YcgR